MQRPLYRLIVSIALALSLIAPSIATAKTTTYRVHLLIRATPYHDYLTLLLRASLNASKKPNEIIKIVFNETDLTQARWIAELQKGKDNSVVWTISTKEREKLLRPVRIPLLRGLYGYRVLAIRPESAPLMAKVRTAQDLAKFTAGLNPHWPDAALFQDNQLPIVEGTFASNLYRMLAAGRFDYFPRGVLEMTEERPFLEANKLILEPNLLIYYPSNLYFFVNKDNEELASRLERGLRIMLNNGEFDRLFYNHREIVDALEIMANRHIITLNNPLLPEGSELFPPSYFQNHLPKSSKSPTKDR